MNDGDGLSNTAEFILGTNSNKYSTTDDGISDGAKFEQGLDLFNGQGWYCLYSNSI